MKDYSNDEFVKAIRAGYNRWKPAHEDYTFYEDMSDKHIKNCIKMLEDKKRVYIDIEEELNEKILEMIEYLKMK